MTNILVTAFEPFGGDAVNPSWEAVRKLPDRIEGAAIHTLRLPVVFGKAGDMLIEAVGQLRPDLVFCCGVAQGRRALTPELVAVNWRMATLKDNGGAAFHGEKIDSGAPAAYMTRLPVMDMTAALAEAGIPASLSLSAGAYVCNDLYFRLLAEESKHGYRGVFIHVPGQEVLSADEAARGLLVCLQTAIKH